MRYLTAIAAALLCAAALLYAGFRLADACDFHMFHLGDV